MKMSILSERSAQSDHQIKLAGKIRPGIKVLTQTAKKNPVAVQIYADGVRRRLKYSEIEKQIRANTPIQQPMYPQNTAYFNVSATDFGMPEIAGMVIDLYGEVREDHSNEKQLYRFPVVFHSDSLEEIYPNQLKRYGGEPGYESHYGDDGVRYCRYLPEVTAEQLAHQKARRFKRAPRRDPVVRGLCQPAVCEEFLMGQCRFRGRLHFYIPGVATGLLGMETTSQYAAETIWSDLDQIREALGYIPRTNPNKPGANIFYITKVLEQRTYFDEHGKKQTGYQWVPKLQADIDLGSLMKTAVKPQLGSSSAPVAWLVAPKGMPDATVIDGVETLKESAHAKMVATGPLTVSGELEPYEQFQELTERMQLDENDVGFYFDVKLGPDWINDETKILSCVQMLSDLSRVGNQNANHLIQISNQVHTLGIPHNEFLVYASSKFGKGFTGKLESLLAIRQHLADLEDSGPGSAQSVIRRVLDRTPQTA